MKELNELLPLSSFDTLAEAQGFEHKIETYKVTAGRVRGFFMDLPSDTHADKWTELHAIRTAITNPFFSVADAVIGVVEQSSYFDVDPNSTMGQKNLTKMKGLADVGFMTQAQADQFVALSIIVNKPYAETTQEDLEKSKQGATYTAQQTQWTQGQDLVIDLQTPLEKETNATCWLVEPGFADENLGKPCRIKESLKYRVRMTGKRGTGTVEVRVPVENALFSLEAI